MVSTDDVLTTFRYSSRSRSLAHLQLQLSTTPSLLLRLRSLIQGLLFRLKCALMGIMSRMFAKPSIMFKGRIAQARLPNKPWAWPGCQERRMRINGKRKCPLHMSHSRAQIPRAPRRAHGTPAGRSPGMGCSWQRSRAGGPARPVGHGAWRAQAYGRSMSGVLTRGELAISTVVAISIAVSASPALAIGGDFALCRYRWPLEVGFVRFSHPSDPSPDGR